MVTTKQTDVSVKKVSLYLIPVQTRMPLKFGSETLFEVTCARACVTVEDRTGKTAEGWGETPMSVQWVWPSQLPYAERFERLTTYLQLLAGEWVRYRRFAHPIELGYGFQTDVLEPSLEQFNQPNSSDHSKSSNPQEQSSVDAEPMPYLAGLVAASVFDQAIHDAYGNLHEIDIYQTYNSELMNQDLSFFLDSTSDNSFQGKFPADFLIDVAPIRLPVWHLVGGLDPLTPAEQSGDEPDDGYPVNLEEWIRRDGLNCLKIKLRGNDSDWDFARLSAIGKISERYEVDWLSADFNCTVSDPDYVNDILDRLQQDHDSTFQKILYVEQPFPYDLEQLRLDVRSVSERKPLFLDESAHDWKYVRLGKELGWSGVALKTCKTQTGALLSLCWAKAHGMPLMVQDLTNPMLAQIPHVRLAAHAGTIMGVESNAMQFYPDASLPEQVVHPGIYQRRHGVVDLSTIQGNGFGYRNAEIERKLDPPVLEVGS